MDNNDNNPFKKLTDLDKKVIDAVSKKLGDLFKSVKGNNDSGQQLKPPAAPKGPVRRPRGKNRGFNLE